MWSCCCVEIQGQTASQSSLNFVKDLHWIWSLNPVLVNNLFIDQNISKLTTCINRQTMLEYHRIHLYPKNSSKPTSNNCLSIQCLSKVKSYLNILLDLKKRVIHKDPISSPAKYHYTVELKSHPPLQFNLLFDFWIVTTFWLCL